MLVAVEPDAVPETMDEEVAVPRLRDDRPCRCVDRSRGRALVRGVVSRLLRAANDVVDLHGLGAGTASDLHGAGDVRAVTRARPAEVEHDGVARADHAVAGAVVRRGAVLA